MARGIEIDITLERNKIPGLAPIEKGLGPGHELLLVPILRGIGAHEDPIRREIAEVLLEIGIGGRHIEGIQHGFDGFFLRGQLGRIHAGSGLRRSGVTTGQEHQEGGREQEVFHNNLF